MPPPDEDVYSGQFAAAELASTSELEGLAYAAIGLGPLEVVLLVGPAFTVGAKRSSRAMALIAATGAPQASWCTAAP